MSQRASLSGNWERRIDGTLVDTVPVPGHYPPVGQCALETQIRGLNPTPGSRLFLCTEGVLAKAVFRFNGEVLGTAGPWSAYRFEIPPNLVRAENTLTAEISDITEYFGPTPGRRFDAGLIRDIYLEERPAAFLRDMVFRYELVPDFSSAQCRVTVERDGAADGDVEIRLEEKATGRVVAVGAEFTIDWPRLWSPEMPNLYTLTARRGEDTLTESVGFRRIEVRGHDFFLNDKRLILKGVCRHEFTSASGYSPAEAEVRRDMALIRHAGFNYVRLVHSPQAEIVCRAAAEVGLLVSEEPGTCFHDLADERVVAPALECLTRLVQRDRNVPSVFAWLIYNECNPNTEYAKRAAGIIRDLDPSRLISMADCSGQNDQVKDMVREAGLDFYGINLYTYWPSDFVTKMETFPDLPLVFTEWGGLFGEGNARVLKDLGNVFVRHSRPEQAARAAGFSFWAWADYEEYSRDEPAAIEGWTIEGLVDKRGRPKTDMLTLSLACFDIDHPEPRHKPQITQLSPAPARPGRWEPVALTEIVGNQSGLEAEVETIRAKYAERPPALGQLQIAGLPFACRDADDTARPLLLGPGQEEIFIPIGQTVQAIAILGHTALQGGYPASGVYSVHHRDAEPVKSLGELASEYVLEFSDGSESVPLQHGLEIVRSNAICRWWKTAPRTPATRPALEIVLHPSYEILRIDLWEHPLPEPRFLTGVRWRLTDKQSIQALYAVSVQVGA